MDAASDAACGRVCGLTRPVDVYVSFERENRGRGVSLFRGLLRRGRFAPLFVVTPPPSLCSSCKNDTKPLLQFQQWAGRGSDARSGFGTPKPALRVTHTTETLSRLAGAAVASNGIPSKPSAQAKPSSTGPATAVSTEPRQCAVGGNETRRLSRTTTRSGGSGHAIASASIAVLPPRQGRAALLRIVAPAAGVSSGERRNPSRRKRSPSPTLPPGRVSQHASKDP